MDKRAFDAQRRRDMLRHWGLIAVGCAVGAITYPLFLLPNGIAPGGLTGIATILNYLFGFRAGVTSLLLNLPLFFLAFHRMGKRFLLRTIAATVLFSGLIDLFRLPPLTHDPMMAAIFGGVLLGAGLGIILRGGATTGGTDLLARLVHKRFSAISIGAILFAFDVAVILLAGFTMSPEHAMYSLVCVYISSRVLDGVLSGVGTDKACHIITSKGDLIMSRLMNEVGRGVTVVRATGAFSGNEVRLLICVVGRMEITLVKQIVKEEDPRAFVFITDTHETLGEGFRNLTGEDL